MAGIRNWQPPNRWQPQGSEFGGVQPTIAGGIQPKGEDALDNGDRLRLGYLTGQEDNTDMYNNIDDRRQMLGLRPASGQRPIWLDNVSPTDDPRLESEAKRQGYEGE